MVYYRLARGETCNWGMLKDTQAPVSRDTRKPWTYVEWRLHAERLAQEEFDLASEQGREVCEHIMETRVAEFEAWWRIEGKKDAQEGGAKDTASRGYSLLGTRTVLPAFMSRQADSGDPISTALSHLKLDGPADHLPSTRVANTRQRFGKDTSEGRSDLDAKRTANRHGKSRKIATATPGNDKGPLSGKGRKGRHTNTIPEHST